MKPSLKSTTWKAITTALLLALIVVTSPCSVRNHLERILDVQTTQVSNKSKTSSCSSFERIEQRINKEIHNDENMPQPIAVKACSYASIFTAILQNTSLKEHAIHSLSVPFYILYGSSKYHLSIA